ncbi:hypothetical protein [Streptomyces sp. NPDC001410]|uniref:hypothetical protein n=1 Tax=Streptomyces sp. NPDC001410 TaxID=3364574 RepID=UPI0036A7D6AB
MLTRTDTNSSALSAGLIAPPGHHHMAGHSPDRSHSLLPPPATPATPQPLRDTGRHRAPHAHRRDRLRLGPATTPPPGIGPRLRPITPTEVALRFDSTPYRKRIPAGRSWTLMLGQRTPVALVLGLDPLARSATPTEIDSYQLRWPHDDRTSPQESDWRAVRPRSPL